MPRVAQRSKNETAEILASVFKVRGYDGASLRDLAQATGLSKANLYHHFPNGKDDMAAYVLGRTGLKLQQLVLAPLASSETGRERLLKSIEGTAAFYSGEVPVCLMNSIMVGTGADKFGPDIQKTVQAWRQALAKAFVDIGQNADSADEQAARFLSHIQGALIFCRLEKSRGPLENALKSLQQDIVAVS